MALRPALFRLSVATIAGLATVATGSLVSVALPAQTAAAAAAVPAVGSFVPTAVTTAGYTSAASAQPVVVDDLTTETSLTVREPDGAYRAYLYTSPINYQDESGDWAPIENQLVPVTDASDAPYAVENSANEFKALLPDDADVTPVRLEGDLNPESSESEPAWVSLQMRGLAGSAPVVSGTTATYVPADPNSAEGGEASSGLAAAETVDYAATATGVKESINLTAPPADPSTSGQSEGPATGSDADETKPGLSSGAADADTGAAAKPVNDSLEYVYEILASDQLTANLTEGGAVEFSDVDAAADAAPFVSIPAGVMFDSTAPEAATSDALTYDLRPLEGGASAGTRSWVLTMTVTPDGMAWLRDDERAYPVTIDPTLNYQQEASKDCWVNSNAPTNNYCGDPQQYIRVGRNGSEIRQRGLVDFNVSSIPEYADVSQAALNLYLEPSQSDTSNQGEYSIYQAGREWTTGATWRNSGNGLWANAGGDPQGSARGTLSLAGNENGFREFTNLGPVVQGWVNGSVPRTGFVVKQRVESTNNVLSFRSDSSQNDSLRNPNDPNAPAGSPRYGRKPFLGVSYTLPGDRAQEGGERDFWQYDETELTDRTKAKVNLGNGNLLVSSNDATVKGVAGWDMALTRYYNSAAHDVGVAHMGQGWTTAFGGSVRLEFPNAINPGNVAGKDKVHFWGPSGYRTIFSRDGAQAGGNGSGTTFTRPAAGIKADLKINKEGLYEVKFFDQSKYLFTQDDGRLRYTRDKNGNELRFEYGTAAGLNGNVLTRVVDTRGRDAVLTYANGVVDSVTIRNSSGAALLRWKYGYQLGATPASPASLVSAKLEAVSSSLGTAIGSDSSTDTNIGAETRYSYYPSTARTGSPGRLSAIVDARDSTSSDGSGGRTEFTYSMATGSGEEAGPPGKLETVKRVTDKGGAAANSDPTTTYRYVQGAGDDGVCKKTDGQMVDKNASARTIVNGARVDAEDTTRYCIDSEGRVLRVTDANMKKRSKSYVGNSNVKTADLTGTGDGTQQYTYGYEDGNDNATSTTSAEGANSEATYGTKGGVNEHSPTSVQGDDSGGNSDRWIYKYDDRNNVIGARGPGQESGTLANDEGAKTSYRYCWTGKGLINRIDPVTATDTWSHSVNPPEATRDDKENLKSDSELCNVLTGSSQGNDVIFTYNGANELQKVDRPNGGDQAFEYDALSRISSVTDERGVRTSYKYDGLDHVVRATYEKIINGQVSDSQVVNWTIDPAGNTTEINDGNGQNRFGYDELNRKEFENAQNPSGDTTYGYDEASNVISITVGQPGQPGGEPEPTRYTYDKLNRLTDLNDQRPGDATISFEYDNHNKVDKTVFPMGQGQPALIQETRWNEDGNAKCMYSFRSGAPLQDRKDSKSTCPAMDASGLITFNEWNYHKDAETAAGPDTGVMTGTKYAVTELGGRSTSYEYDNIMRLRKAVTRPGTNTSANPLREFAYSYDRHSNLIKDVTTGTTPGLNAGTRYQAFNPGDQLCASVKSSTEPTLSCDSGPGSTTYFKHDDDGNLKTALGGGTDTLDGLTLNYNLPAQTTTIDPPGPVGSETNAYDGVMQDRRTQSGSTNMSYGFKGLNAQSTAASGSQGAHGEVFVRDPSGKLLAMLDRSNWSASYYLTDDKDSVIGLMPQSGANVIRYLYEPYGERIRSWVDTTPGMGANTGSENAQFTAPNNDYNPWGYGAGYLDKNTGFIKFGTRYYMPQHATWTQMDPESGKVSVPTSLNIYSYSSSNPINNSDPTGRVDWDALAEFGDLLYTGAGNALKFGGYGAAAGFALTVYGGGGGAVPGAAVGATFGASTSIIYQGVYGEDPYQSLPGIDLFY